jgi:haloacid dehalogenase superfamily, subfamily IA, variant 3 with third motif having DD or ED
LKGVIFDFNGTLFWDSAQQELAWKTFAKELAHKEISELEFQKYIHGRSNDFILEYLMGRSLSQDELNKLSERKEECYRQLCIDQLSFQLAPGAAEFLDYLKSKDIPRSIATSSGETNVDFYIHQLGLEKWFEHNAIVYNDGSIRGKPAPDIYIKAARAIHRVPQNCIVFEDAVSGIIAANAADIGKIIAVAHKDNWKYFESMKEVHSIISNYYEFLNKIQY